MKNYANKLKTQLFWWLKPGRPFSINDEYRIDLLHIDSNTNMAKILITNLKTNQVVQQDLSPMIDE